MSEHIPYVQEDAALEIERADNVYLRQSLALREARQERDAAYALLRACHPALFAACCTADGLDCSEGVPLLEKIEALFPDLKPPPGRPVL